MTFNNNLFVNGIIPLLFMGPEIMAHALYGQGKWKLKRIAHFLGLIFFSGEVAKYPLPNPWRSFSKTKVSTYWAALSIISKIIGERK